MSQCNHYNDTFANLHLRKIKSAPLLHEFNCAGTGMLMRPLHSSQIVTQQSEIKTTPVGWISVAHPPYKYGVAQSAVFSRLLCKLPPNPKEPDDAAMGGLSGQVESWRGRDNATDQSGLTL